MKYRDYIRAWLVYGKHNKKTECNCIDCLMQRKLENANPVFFTAADLKAARLETVEKCFLAGLDYVDNPQNADLMYHGGLEGFIAVFKNLKEEIENE